MLKYLTILILLFGCNTVEDDKDQIRLFFTNNQIELSQIVGRIISVYNISLDKRQAAKQLMTNKIDIDSSNSNDTFNSIQHEIKLIKLECEKLKIRINLVTDKNIEFEMGQNINSTLLYLLEDNSTELMDNCKEEYFFEPCSFKITKHWYGQIERREHGIS